MVPRAPVKGAVPINYHLKSEVSIALCCQLCLTCYTAVQIKNCLKATSVIEEATMKNTNGSTHPDYMV